MKQYFFLKYELNLWPGFAAIGCYTDCRSGPRKSRNTMSWSPVSSFLAITVILPTCFAGQPVMRVLNPSTQIVTSAASVSLRGVASADTAIVSVYWVDQQGNRSAAQW